MASTKRKDKNRQPKYQREEEDALQASDDVGKNILLLVEGETEQGYFEELRKNSWLNGRLAGLKVEIVEKGTAFDYAKKEGKNYIQIWIVLDNDKRNAFILEKVGLPFFRQLRNNPLPDTIVEGLNDSYNTSLHNYFLSVYDYLQWLRVAIGAENIIEYWDKIQKLTSKTREFEALHHQLHAPSNTKIKLAYSCIAFELWLVLHFEFNNTPFLWVDKGKNASVDVVTYFRETFRGAYLKGYKKDICHAYATLFDDHTKTYFTSQEQWLVLVRIIQACKNAEQLRLDRQAILDRQLGRWYEVNPYILGLDDLMYQLLPIKKLREEVVLGDCTIVFDFDKTICQLSFRCMATQNAFRFNNQNKESCLIIKDSYGEEYSPNDFDEYRFPNNQDPVFFQYEIPENLRDSLVLLFKNPNYPTRRNEIWFVLS